MARRIIFCDFDGTITDRDIGNIILNHFTQSRWSAIEKEFIYGRIGSAAAYKKIAPYIQGTKEEIEAFIEKNFDIDEEFLPFLQNCRKNKDKPIILSDGFDIYIKILLKKRGLLKKIKYLANTWSFKEDGKVSISFPFYNPGCEIEGGRCGNCKKGHILTRKNENFKARFSSEIIYIGNGYSDRCAITQADIVLAKDFLKEYCIKNSIDFLPFNNFHDVNNILFDAGYFRNKKRISGHRRNNKFRGL